MTESEHLTPSLLEPQSRGGDIAEGGFSFQEQVMLARIPAWLAQDGFTAMIREGIGDVEAKFFVPGRGFAIEFLEFKDHTLQPSKFLNEIQRFREVDAGSPDTYQQFILVAAGVSRDLEPLVNGLRRVRNPQDFYEENSTVKENSFKEYTRLVKKIGGTEQDAFFIFEKVIVEADWNTAKSHGEALFKQSLAENLSEYEDLSFKTFDNIYNHLGTFIRQRKNQIITRKELETKLREKISPSQLPALRPILIYTAIASENNPEHHGLCFDWASFSGGETRAIALSQQWNHLLIELQDTRSWIEKYRNTKRIRLAGNRRLAACLAIGSVFSAVRGYAIEMEYRGEVWATDAHPTQETPVYPLAHQIIGGTGTRLVVSIGILRDIIPEVEVNLEKYGLTGEPLLHIRGEQPITSPQHANNAVGSIKKLIVNNLVCIGGKEIHLFFAGPAHLALFLGHRLDATAPVTCYAWVSNSQYSKTFQLFSGIAS
ncbi:CD-NTase-associated endodeoxyribonuclease Cap4 [Scytonema sp. PRP1]|uniref:CD-NTase-associated endodeoxyribonuclease Cap4 n=1 Tax=Scytonema sp. PRP1 TaxID=3120513 RepID=UPI00300D6D7B